MNKKLCTALHLLYHALFGSTMVVVGNDYLEEIRKAKKEIIRYADLIETNLSRAEKACKKISLFR